MKVLNERARKNESVGENGTRNGVTVLPEREIEETNENRRDFEVVASRGHQCTPARAARRGGSSVGLFGLGMLRGIDSSCHRATRCRIFSRIFTRF